MADGFLSSLGRRAHAARDTAEDYGSRAAETVRERGGAVVGRAILGDNHGGIADIEIHVAGGDDIPLVILDPSRRR